jgi:hypothetical protein
VSRVVLEIADGEVDSVLRPNGEITCRPTYCPPFKTRLFPVRFIDWLAFSNIFKVSRIKKVKMDL